jgi:hypothetical protein
MREFMGMLREQAAREEIRAGHAHTS